MQNMQNMRNTRNFTADVQHFGGRTSNSALWRLQIRSTAASVSELPHFRNRRMWVVEGKFEHLDNMAYRNVIARRRFREFPDLSPNCERAASRVTRRSVRLSTCSTTAVVCTLPRCSLALGEDYSRVKFAEYAKTTFCNQR
jgi:hypothetical protein